MRACLDYCFLSHVNHVIYTTHWFSMSYVQLIGSQCHIYNSLALNVINYIQFIGSPAPRPHPKKVEKVEKFETAFSSFSRSLGGLQFFSQRNILAVSGELPHVASTMSYGCVNLCSWVFGSHVASIMSYTSSCVNLCFWAFGSHVASIMSEMRVVFSRRRARSHKRIRRDNDSTLRVACEFRTLSVS